MYGNLIQVDQLVNLFPWTVSNNELITNSNNVMNFIEMTT